MPVARLLSVTLVKQNQFLIDLSFICTLTVSSSDAETSLQASCEKATQCTQPEWPLLTPKLASLMAFHSCKHEITKGNLFGDSLADMWFHIIICKERGVSKAKVLKGNNDIQLEFLEGGGQDVQVIHMVCRGITTPPPSLGDARFVNFWGVCCWLCTPYPTSDHVQLYFAFLFYTRHKISLSYILVYIRLFHSRVSIPTVD